MTAMTFPVDTVHEVLRAQRHGLALQALAEALDDADRGSVLGPDETDDAVLLEDGEGIDESRPCGLGGVAVPPPAPRQSPGQLEAWPALRLGKTDHPDEGAGLLLLDSPHAGPPELRIAEEIGQVPPGPAPVPRPPDEAHHLGVRVHRGEVLEVARTEGP